MLAKKQPTVSHNFTFAAGCHSVKQADAPVFIVGPSRCGTTLLQTALSRHQNIHICAETHWFDDDRCQRDALVETESQRTQVQNWFLSLSDQPFGHRGNPENGWLDRETFENEAQSLLKGDSSDSSDGKTGTAKSFKRIRDNYFYAFCKMDARRHKKQRWGEKTPRHVFRMDEILEVFPKAKILCSLRDPRSMVTSYKRWSAANSHNTDSENNTENRMLERQRTQDSYHPAIAAMLWRSAARATLNGIKERGDDRIKLVRYESLVNDPETTLKEMSLFLDEPFDKAMMDVPVINSSFDDFQNQTGFKKQAIDRWQQELSRSEVAVVRLLCKREMAELGYRVDQNSPVLWPLYAIPTLATLPMAIYRASRANRDRTGNIFGYIWRRVSA